MFYNKWAKTFINMVWSSANSALCGSFFLSPYDCKSSLSSWLYARRHLNLRDSTWGKEITFCHSWLWPTSAVFTWSTELPLCECVKVCAERRLKARTGIYFKQAWPLGFSDYETVWAEMWPIFRLRLVSFTKAI